MDLLERLQLLMSTRGKLIRGKYIIKARLGKRQLGDVYLVEEGKGGPQLTLQAVSKKVLDDNNLTDYFLGGVACMKSLDSSYLVKLKEFFQQNETYYMIYDHYDGRDLLQLQSKQPNRIFTLQLATECLTTVILGLEALHKSGYIHRDIKPQNVLVKYENGRPVLNITNFGFAKKTENINGTVLGTEQFIAPEIYQEGIEEYDGQPYGFEVDMWAFGVMFFFMMNMEFPFKINPLWTFQDKCKQLRKQAEHFSYRKAVANTKKKNLESCTDEVEDLFRRLFCINQKKRITFSKIRQHPVFASFFPASMHFYTESMSTIQVKNRLQEIAMEMSVQRLSAPSTIFVLKSVKFFAEKQQLLKLELEEINFLSDIAEEFQSIQGEIGTVPFLMLAFNLTKYHLVLFKQHFTSLTAENYNSKYPGLDWERYFLTPQFAENNSNYANAIAASEAKFRELYKKCRDRLKDVCGLNASFGVAFSELITEGELSGDFFGSYRKSTNIVYMALKELLKREKVLRLEYFLCMTCIAHVFNVLHESEQLKRGTFSAFLSEVSDCTAKEKRVSYKKVANYLRTASEELLLTLVKKIIDGIMIPG